MAATITNMAVEIAAPYPILKPAKTVRYIYVAITSEELDGPPPVITYTMSKYRSDPMRESTMAVRMVP